MVKSHSKHRGMALVMVLSVIGVCTVLGYAMLSSTSLQSQMSANLSTVSSADYVAESGINIGLYLLTNEAEGPSGFLVGNGPWTMSNVTVNGAGDKVNITVSKALNASNVVIASTYDIQATTQGTIARTLKARAKIETAYKVRYAISSNPTVTIMDSSSATGTLAIESATSVVIERGGSVTGAIVAPSLTKDTGTPAAIHTGTHYQQSGQSVPSLAQVNDYVNASNQYVIDGVTYTATVLSGTQNSVTRVPTATNPAGIFILSGDATITSNVQITGTLIVKNGRLTLNGSNNTITRAAAGYPALIVDQDISVSGKNRTLTINGVAYTGEGITRPNNNDGSQITINGALLIYSGGIDSSYNGDIDVNYNSALVDVPSFSTINAVPETVRVIDWEEIHP
jgi:Tfp pilus assembly protein PilX